MSTVRSPELALETDDVGEEVSVGVGVLEVVDGAYGLSYSVYVFVFVFAGVRVSVSGP